MLLGGMLSSIAHYDENQAALWREPTTRAFSLYKIAGDNSTDNGVLFTVVAWRDGLVSKDDLSRIIARYESPEIAGILLRYPGSPNYMSWDDHLAASVGDPVFAVSCYEAMEALGWKTPNGNFLGRIPLFYPTVKAAAKVPLSLVDKILAIGAVLINALERKSETSGKQLVWLALPTLRANGRLLRAASWIWAACMWIKYGSAPSKMFEIYYKEPGHPFVSTAPKTWIQDLR